MSMQAGYVSGVSAAGGYLVAVPLLTIEVIVLTELVFLIDSTGRVPTLTVGQEVVVAFIDGNLNTPAVIAARPMEG